MTNRIAIILGFAIVTGLLFDTLLRDGATTIFLLQKFTDFVEWVAFWR